MKTLLCILVLMLGSMRTAEACSCGSQPVCGRFEFSSDVFVGKVLAKRIVQPGEFVGKYRVKDPSAVYTISVAESFAGGHKAGQTVEVMSGLGGTDCSYHFVVGAEYLVDAFLDDGMLYTIICTNTGRVENRTIFLRELRMLKQGQPLPALTGSISKEIREPLWPKQELTGALFRGQPLPGIRVDLKTASGETRLQAVTDSAGVYRLDVVPHGKYRITINNLPSDLQSVGSSADPYAKEVWLDIGDSSGGGPACHVWFVADPTGRIGGKILGRVGVMKHGVVEARAIRLDGAISDAVAVDFPAKGGSFVLRELLGGRYQIRMKDESGKQRGEAVIVDLKDGEKKTGLKLVVPWRVR